MSDEPPIHEPSRRQWVGFWSMIVQQAQNAFNDKMAQFILVPLGGAVGFAVESQAGLMIALPFVLFAPIAGWLSDRFSKRDVMVGSAALQLLVLIWICAAVFAKNLPFALFGFFALATQAAFFSPAKIGINKELVGSHHLGFATGIQQMTTMLAMLIGQIVAGIVFDHRYHALGATPDIAWQAALIPLLVLTVLSAPALIIAWIIPRVPAQGSGKFTIKLTVSHFTNLADLWRDKPLRQASFGVAFFWGFAAYINLWSVKLAKVVTGGGEGFGTLSSMFMAAASLGMAGGFGFASFLLRKRIELGWVPVAGVVMTLIAFAMIFIPEGGPCFLIALALLAFVSALFLAPLNAWMQDRYPPAKRGELQAAANLQDCFAGILAVLLVTAFEYAAQGLGFDAVVGFRLQMLFVGLACALATVLIIRLLPAHFLRIILLGIIRTTYRIRVTHADRLPKHGGVLLLPNHVTYADAFFIAASCPRPVRFVMEEAFTEKRTIRVFTEIFDTLTIRRTHPLEAIREIIHSLNHGAVVCLFPEGQLTRTGTLNVLQRGFEMIAKKTDCPMIPVWCDGSWGSIFSFERNCYFRKIPHRLEHDITLAFGLPIPPKQANPESLRDGLLATSADAAGLRFHERSCLTRMPQARNPATLAFRMTNEIERRKIWINGHQIAMINALQRRQSFHMLHDDPILTNLPGLCVAFPELFHAKILLHQSFDGAAHATWVGGDCLRTIIRATPNSGKVTFYDFGSDLPEPIESPGLLHCPCLAIDGLVIAMSMPHPPAPLDNFAPQLGHQPQSRGKLLPGWFLKHAPNGSVRVHGPAAPDVGLPLPAGCTLDDQGFIIGC